MNCVLMADPILNIEDALVDLSPLASEQLGVDVVRGVRNSTLSFSQAEVWARWVPDSGRTVRMGSQGCLQ